MSLFFYFFVLYLNYILISFFAVFMPYRSRLQISHGRHLNPQYNPSAVDSVGDFKEKSIISKKNQYNKITFIPLKLSNLDKSQHENADANTNTFPYYHANNSEETAKNNNLYTQSNVSVNYILPFSLLDSRLSLDYIDNAVKSVEDNAYLAQIFSDNAYSSSREARFDAERTNYALEHSLHNHNYYHNPHSGYKKY